MTVVEYDGDRYRIREGESVLDALIRGGASIAFSCRSGACHVCMMRVIRGELDQGARRRLRPELVETGHFLPCCTHPAGDLVIDQPSLALLRMSALVTGHLKPCDDLLMMQLEPEYQLSWRPGQYVDVVRGDGLARSYSIASVAEEDYYLTLHVARSGPSGVSAWLHDRVREGDELQIQGPMGDCVYDPADAERPLVLVGTGTGLAPLYGILRDALRQGHTGPVELYHGASSPDGHYLDREATGDRRGNRERHVHPGHRLR
jgi:CDP-4-dehydro-6-deoxyglucose reductase, E3